MTEKKFECPHWLKDGVMYQIFPDRFCKSKDYIPPIQNKDYILREWGEIPEHLPDSHGVVRNNDFFGGNLQGIIEKLPYLLELGVTVIYLNPIFEAYSNHRYDTANYMKIDPMLGTEKDFIQLCKEAKKVGIRIILDGVFNHTGSDSIYFNKKGRYPNIGAYQSKESIYYSWYRFIDFPEKYESWWGIDTLPSVNETKSSYLDYIIRNKDSVVKHWLRCGASGFRLDVVDELPDIFLDELRRAVKSIDENIAIIGEVWEDASTKVSYGESRRYLQGAQLDSVMNYPLREAIIRFIGVDGDADGFAQVVESLWNNYPETVFYGLMNILGTHDTPRILTLFSEGRSKKESIQKLFTALILWAMMPGIPCIYYGDEIGMEGGRDPFNRLCFEPDKGNPDIFKHYKKLMRFRKQVSDMESLEHMKFEPGFTDESLYVFHRKGKKCRLLVSVNADEKEKLVPLKLKNSESIVNFFISGDVSFIDFNTFCLKGCSGVAVLIV
ncbi:MAG: glycoside hydrolase family 13 protein [Anaerovoracaceae bacterium]|jgi:cyclomaltodextrinase